MDKKILFLSPFFYPEQISTGKYNSFLVEKFLESNYEVDVVAFHPFYPDWCVSKSDAPFNHAKVYRYGEKVRFPKSQILRRIVLELSYFYYVSKHFFRHKNNYDIVISIFPPVLFMFAAGFFLKKAVKVGIVHDVQGIMANAKKSFLHSTAAFLMGLVERNIYKKCDRLICLSYSMKDEIVKKYGVDKGKCEVFYPFVSLSQRKNDLDPNCLSEIFEDGFQHIVYSGALGEKQRPYDLYDFFQKLAVTSPVPVKCHIFSRGPVFDSLLSRTKVSTGNKVMFHDLVDESDVSALFACSTVQVIPQAPGTGAGAFPSKLPNLLAHGVPVFAICDQGSELDRVINKVKSAKSIRTWNPQVMIAEMQDFLKTLKKTTHKTIYLENKNAILKEFDVDHFINSLY